MSSEEIAFWRKMTRDYEDYLIKNSKINPMAVRYGAKSCLRCGQCCLRFCTPRPDEIEPIARFLGITKNDLIAKYMVIDTQDCKTFFLRWAKHGEEDITGKRIPPLRTYDRGYCIMFDEKSKFCLIHPVRPVEARSVKCWKQNNGSDKRLWGICAWSERDINSFVQSFNPQDLPEDGSEGTNIIVPKG